jgi:hypothetical protein
MTTMGKNAKVTIEKRHRAAIERIFLGPLAASRVASDEQKDIYRLSDGNIGFFFVDEADALTPDQARRGAWLELFVDEPASLREELRALGAERFDYTDESNDYYALPGGQVVRLSRAAAT